MLTFKGGKEAVILWQFGRNVRGKPGYRFTKGLTQNLNLRMNLKLEYNKKYHNYIQQN